MSDEERERRAIARYEKAAHAVQSGVASEIAAFGENQAAADPKFLRVGVNLGKVEHGALVELLIKAGIFTSVEYLEAMAAAAEQEQQRYEAHLSGRLGRPVTLR